MALMRPIFLAVVAFTSCAAPPVPHPAPLPVVTAFRAMRDACQHGDQAACDKLQQQQQIAISAALAEDLAETDRSWAIAIERSRYNQWACPNEYGGCGTSGLYAPPWWPW
jgi:hypothetical protein